ncbi:hypothetical protein X975_00802, partial [Stegodyphus mimosarum]
MVIPSFSSILAALHSKPSRQGHINLCFPSTSLCFGFGKQNSSS